MFEIGGIVEHLITIWMIRVTLIAAANGYMGRGGDALKESRQGLFCCHHDVWFDEVSKGGNISEMGNSIILAKGNGERSVGRMVAYSLNGYYEVVGPICHLS
jgi:hypothetical protein